MTFWSILSTLALTGALFATSAVAGDRTGKLASEDRSTFPYGQSTTSSEITVDPTEFARGSSLEGQVVAVEHDSGRLVIDTEGGPISLRTAPEELEGVKVGDIVRVSFDMDEG